MLRQMKIVRKQVEAAILDDRRTHRLDNTLLEIAGALGRSLTRQDTKAAAAFVREYIEYVPHVLEYVCTIGEQVGAQLEVERIVDLALRLWVESNDLFPSALGLVELIDHAYYSNRLLQIVSDEVKQHTGRSLIPRNLKPATAVIRVIIGEPVANQLDALIDVSFQKIQCLEWIPRIVAKNPWPIIEVPVDPIWGHVTTDEIVRQKVGAFSIY